MKDGTNLLLSSNLGDSRAIFFQIEGDEGIERKLTELRGRMAEMVDSMRSDEDREKDEEEGNKLLNMLSKLQPKPSVLLSLNSCVNLLLF